MAFKPILDSHGRSIGVQFKPSIKMLRVVVEFNKSENSSLPTEDILKKCGVSNADWVRWNREYVIYEYGPDKEIIASKNHFEDWFDSALQIKSGEERQMLREIGLQKALEGNFNFWDKMSKTYGAVTGEPLETQKKTIPFNLRSDATAEEIRDARQKLLESQRALGDSGGAGLSRLTAKRPPGSNS